MHLEKSEPDACRKFYIGSIGKSMHWYKRNIGDYAKKAGRLTMLQHGSYTLLMDACYDRERFPTLEQAIEWTWASTSEEVEALKFVLAKFFTLGADGVYTQDRILDELIDYHGKADKNKQIAIDRETKRRENSTNRAQRVHEAPRAENEAPPNQEPVTNNHKPITKDTRAIAPPEGVSLSVWQDFQKLRRQKKAPVTQTAIDGIKREADKAGVTLEAALAVCCQRGWTGFKADWMAQPVNRNDVAAVTVPSRHGVDPALAKIIADASKAKPPSDEIRAKMAAIRG